MNVVKKRRQSYAFPQGLAAVADLSSPVMSVSLLDPYIIKSRAQKANIRALEGGIRTRIVTFPIGNLVGGRHVVRA